MKRREYIITLKVALDADKDLEYDDWIYRSIEEQLERYEDIVNYTLTEVTE